MATDTPVLVGQRIQRVRRMTVKEQSELGFNQVTRTGPVVIELESGVRVFAVTDEYEPAVLTGATKKDDLFDVSPSKVEVSG